MVYFPSSVHMYAVEDSELHGLVQTVCTTKPKEKKMENSVSRSIYMP